MPAKAVYASGTLALYVSRRQLDRLLEQGTIEVDVFLGKIPVPDARAQILLGPVASAVLTEGHRAYQGALKAGTIRWPRGAAGRFGPGDHPNTQQGGANEGA